jgi:hypothetical protein
MSTIKVDGIRSNSASSDAITLASDGTCTANITNNLSNRNKVINGAMAVHQRDTSVTGITASGYRTADRMDLSLTNGGTWTNTISTDTPDGFADSYKLDCTTADTSLSGSDKVLFRTILEGQDLQDFAKGTSSAKKFTVSFYIKTNKTGTYVLELYDNSNSRHASKTYTVSNTNWNRYTLSFPADTTGAFANSNAAALYMHFWLAAGPDYTGGTTQTSWGSQTNGNRAHGLNVNIADSTSNEWLITGIQLEVDHTGSGVATDFEHRSYGQELVLCQRYFQALSLHGLAASQTPYDSSYRCYVPFKQTMRAIPTITYPSISNFQPGGATGTASGANATVDGVLVNTGSNNTNSNYIPNWVNDTSAIMKASAEL